MSFEIFLNAITISQAVVLIIGLIGNLISFIIFSRKKFRKNSISTYCRVLAVFESLVLVELIVNVGQIFFNILIIDLSDVACKIFFYVSAEYASMSAWTLVAFSLDKMLNMKKRRSSILKNKCFQWSIVAIIVVFNLLLFIEVPIILKREYSPFYTKLFYCDISSIPFYNAFIIVYLFESGLIPFAVMLISSIVTIILLIKSGKALEQAGNLDTRRKTRDTKYAISSLTFNFAFIAFKMPLVVIYILIAYNSTIDLYFYYISLFLYYFNASSTFFIHFISNSLFRREFFAVFRRMTRDNSSVSPIISNRVALQTN